MSSLTTTSINTANGTTDLTVATGNTSGPAVVVTASETIYFRGNSTSNIATANLSSVVIRPSVTMNDKLTVDGQLSVNGTSILTGNTVFSANVTVQGRISAVTNVSTNTVTANTIAVVNGSVSSNAFTLGASSITATQYANGYTRLPNGLLLQWGTVLANTTTGAVTFPAAFGPVFSMTATANDKSTTCMAAVTALTNTTATVLLASNVSQRTVYWQAIGL